MLGPSFGVACYKTSAQKGKCRGFEKGGTVMTCSDEWNLPPGVTPSMLPGNSRKEVAVERAMEKAQELVGETLDVLYGVPITLRDACDDGPEEAQHDICNVQDRLEEVQVKLDNALNILGRVLE